MNEVAASARQDASPRNGKLCTTATLQQWVVSLSAAAVDQLAGRDATVVHLGCGGGELVEWIGRKREDLRLLGIDSAAEVLAAGNRRLRENGMLDRVVLLRGGPTEFVRFLPGRIDMVVVVVPTPWLGLCDQGQLPFVVEDLVRRYGCAVWMADLDGATERLVMRVRSHVLGPIRLGWRQRAQKVLFSRRRMATVAKMGSVRSAA